MSYRISEYDSSWPDTFKAIQGMLAGVFGTKALQIEHVGSTSVPGMTAKPIIDVLVIVPNIDELDTEKKAIEDLGYFIRENVLEKRSLLFEKKTQGEKTENIHIFEQGAEKANQLLVMKEYYLTHPERVSQYENLKVELYKKFPESYEDYRKGKKGFLDETERLAKEWISKNK